MVVERRAEKTYSPAALFYHETVPPFPTFWADREPPPSRRAQTVVVDTGSELFCLTQMFPLG